MRPVAIAFLLWLAVLAPTAAQMAINSKLLDLVDARIDYQAEYRLRSGNAVFHGTVTHAPQRERWEFGAGDGRQILLLRRDLDEASMLWPQHHFYMATSLATLSGMLGGLDHDVLHAREAGYEKLGGEMTTRYHVDRGAFVGDFWRSQDGIVVKAAGKLTYLGQPTDGELVLSNLRRGKSDPSLFVRPEGYVGIPFSTGK